MNKNDETVSAFIDHELSNSEQCEQVDLAVNDVNYRYQMARYQLIGDVMRKETGDKINTHFYADVSAKIAQLEPHAQSAKATQLPQSNSPSLLSQWFKPLSGLAVAASVAWIAVFSLQNVVVQNGDLELNEQIAVHVTSPDVSQQVEFLAKTPVIQHSTPVSANAILQPGSGQLKWQSHLNQPVSQAKLNSYLVEHTEYSTSMQGMIPQARVAGFDLNR